MAGNNKTKFKKFNERFEYFAWKHPIPAYCVECVLYLACCPCACVGLVVGARLTGKCGHSRMMEQQRKPVRIMTMYFQDRERALKRRKSLSERPSLSLSHLALLKKRLYTQEKSPLFAKLPAELRVKIFEYVLSDEPYLHVYPYMSRSRKAGRGRFKVADCFTRTGLPVQEVYGEGDSTGTPWAVEHRRCLEFHEMRRGIGIGTRGSAPDSPRYRFLPLLMTCRRVYTEAIHLLYSNNTFATSMGYNIINFSRTVPDSHFSLITSLVLFTSDDIEPNMEAWKGTLHILRQMPNLRNCHVIFQQTPWDFQSGLLSRSQDFVNALKELPTRRAFVVEFLARVVLAGSTPGSTVEAYELFKRWVLKDEAE
ncbi:hypothetical protein K458DRAFT_487228 [Lentithecium fluviatile CBS 122367]|uniref:DUF7730 domain-containing protein n=1 Tax=Lentithecium fluviatile CBS 122367 TaxID=1168545 RepID=A0A6G1J1J7_9PLEO|nr:hypothetical protein K458DRAFT_487228 [Lentithecium fluviatile CBS 122367]